MNAKLLGLMACALASTALTATAASAATAAYKAPRTGFGQPDLSGTWSNETATRMERPNEYGERLIMTPAEVAKIEAGRADTVAAARAQGEAGKPEESRAYCEKPENTFAGGCAYNQTFYDGQTSVMRVGGQPRTSLVTMPANGKIPRLPSARRMGGGYDMGNRDNVENRPLPDRCLVGQNISTGALLGPTIYNNTYQFQQNRESVVIVVEMSHDARNIRLNAKHDGLKRWFGDSVGHWEGDTLVVDTIDFHPDQLGASSDKLHLIERFTRVAKDRILYQFRVEDPGAFSAPWGGEYEFSTAKGPQYEYACHEGNYALHGILAGARQDDARGVSTKDDGKVEGE
jgi:hypothetical protein